MDIEEALSKVGGYRRWHMTVFVMLGISIYMHICWHGLIFVFSGWEPEHQCRLHPLNSTDWSSSYPSTPHLSTSSPPIVSQQCSLSDDNGTESVCIYGWEYANEGYFTLIEQFDLVCERNYLSEISQIFYQIGYLVSVLVTSPLVDKFGRKQIFIYTQLLVGVVGVSIAYADNFIMYVALRTLVGFLSLTSCNAGSTYMLEIFDAEIRGKIGIGVEFLWVTNYLMLVPLAYFVKDWRNLQIIISSVAFVWMVFVFILPESPQWLAAIGRTSEAETILNKMAKWNGVTLPEGGIKLISTCQSEKRNFKSAPPKCSVSVISIEKKEALPSHDYLSLNKISPENIKNDTKVDSEAQDTSKPVAVLEMNGHCEPYLSTGKQDNHEVISKLQEDTPNQTTISELNGHNKNYLSHNKVDIEEQEYEAIPLTKFITDKHLRLTLLISNALWFSDCIVYYGLILSTPSLAGNRFLNFAIMGLVEIPAYLLPLYTTDRFGRRVTCCLYHVLAGLPLAFVIFVPEKSSTGADLTPLIITLVMISKFGISASFAVIVLYLREVFPTEIRSTGGGISQVSGNIGNMIAPLCVYATKTPLYWLPNILYGVVAVSVGLLSLLLPETSGKPMPQTLQDLHDLYSERRFVFWRKSKTIQLNSSDAQY